MYAAVESIQHIPNRPLNIPETPRFGSVADLKRVRTKRAREFYLAEATRRARHLAFEGCRMAWYLQETTAADWLNLRPDYTTLSDDVAVAMLCGGDREEDYN